MYQYFLNPMAIFGYLEIIFTSLVSIFIFVLFSNNKHQPRNWPLVGMSPILIFHFHRIQDKFTDILQQNRSTFLLKGNWFSDSDLLLTSDPINMHYILSSNFSNYVKGPLVPQIFDILGDDLFSSDLDEWRAKRKVIRAFFSDPRFSRCSMKLVHNSIGKGLIPVLDHVAKQALTVDLQDLFQRLMFDATCALATGYDPGSLRIGFPEIEFSKAIDDAGEVIFSRVFSPESLWKLKRKFKIGGEKHMDRIMKTLDDTALKYIQMKLKDIKQRTPEEDDECFDALKFYIVGDRDILCNVEKITFLRNLVISLIFAGRDTTSATLTWLFWVLSKNSSVISKIRVELTLNLPFGEAKAYRLFNIEELNKLPYLHAVLCETMRLYPSAPNIQRLSVESDTLPSGHHVKSNMKIGLSFYAMGRMKSVWGHDALEFKPERWVSEKGEFKNEMANKYLFAFSMGPRVCPGRDMAFSRIKTAVAAIVHNYNVEVVKDHPVVAVTSIIHRMKYGLMVNVSKRWD